MNPEQSERVHRWIERLGEELTIKATMDPADVEAILDAAKPQPTTSSVLLLRSRPT